MSTGEGNNLTLKTGWGGANPPAYGERNVGKAATSTWEILPAKRLAAIRLKPKSGKGGRKSEGAVVPMKGRQQNFPEGRAPASTKQPKEVEHGECLKRLTTDMNEPVKPAGFSFGLSYVFPPQGPAKSPDLESPACFDDESN